MDRFRTVTTRPERLFIVGDIHGCRAELDTLLGFLRTQRNLSAGDLLVFVGDYIDRGPDSRGVIETLLELRKELPQTVFLKGNHEDMLLSFLGFEGNLGGSYTYNGGLQTLQNYGFSEFAAPEECRAQLPAAHLDFLTGLERLVVVDDYIVVHAGLNPLRSLEGQVDEDLFWIRDEFIANIHYFDKTVVFGHTPYRDVLLNLPYKIGIDTGLIYGNMLSCVEPFSKEVLQIELGETQVRASTFDDKVQSLTQELAEALDS